MESYEKAMQQIRAKCENKLAPLSRDELNCSDADLRILEGKRLVTLVCGDDEIIFVTPTGEGLAYKPKASLPISGIASAVRAILETDWAAIISAITRWFR